MDAYGDQSGGAMMGSHGFGVGGSWRSDTPDTDNMDELDADISIILGIVTPGTSGHLRTRRQGLLIALPIALIIGAVTVGVVQNEGYLGANPVQSGGTKVTRVAEAYVAPRQMTAPLKLRPSAQSFPVPTMAVLTDGESKRSGSVVHGRRKLAWVRHDAQRHPEQSRSVASQASRITTASLGGDQMSKPGLVASDPPWNQGVQYENRDIKAERKQARLATLDAIRTLRLH